MYLSIPPGRRARNTASEVAATESNGAVATKREDATGLPREEAKRSSIPQKASGDSRGSLNVEQGVGSRAAAQASISEHDYAVLTFEQNELETAVQHLLRSNEDLRSALDEDPEEQIYSEALIENRGAIAKKIARIKEILILTVPYERSHNIAHVSRLNLLNAAQEEQQGPAAGGTESVEEGSKSAAPDPGSSKEDGEVSEGIYL